MTATVSGADEVSKQDGKRLWIPFTVESGGLFEWEKRPGRSWSSRMRILQKQLSVIGGRIAISQT